jgi:DNA-binding Xre family transcriptional regulator
MKKRSATTYTLREKGGISSSTVRRLRRGESVSTNTINDICAVLGCDIPDVIDYRKDED